MTRAREHSRPARLCRLGLWASAALVVCLLGAIPAQADESVTLTILATTDVHGHIYPYDYLTARARSRGLAQVATLVKHLRASQPNTLLVDCGDAFQGTPLAYVAARMHPKEPNPIVTVMNLMGYDALAVGNHEFNFGLETLWRLKEQARFPWLAANLTGYYHDSRRSFPPYVIRDVAGVRVAVLGMVTPAIPNWEVREHYRGYRFHDLIKTAREYVPELRRRADVVLLMVHAGLGRDPVTAEPTPGLPGEDAVWELAEQVQGIDAIIFGHSHQELAGLDVNGVRLVQPKNWGQSVAELRLTLTRGGSQEPWHVVEKESRLIPVDESVEPDAEILELARQVHQAAERWLNTVVAEVPEPVSARTARFEDHPLAEVVERTQLHFGHADVSLTAVFSPWVEIPAGPLTVRHLYALYPYENQLYTIETTGAALRQALEHAAQFFQAYPVAPGQPLTNPRMLGYNFDIAGGVSYEIDLAKPVGERIVNLQFQGQPLDPARKLRLALNSYRYAGGGGYTMFRGAKILQRVDREIRDLLIDYLREQGTLSPAVDNNWRIIPHAARQALLDSVRPAPVAANLP